MRRRALYSSDIVRLGKALAELKALGYGAEILFKGEDDIREYHFFPRTAEDVSVSLPVAEIQKVLEKYYYKVNAFGWHLRYYGEGDSSPCFLFRAYRGMNYYDIFVFPHQGGEQDA